MRRETGPRRLAERVDTFAEWLQHHGEHLEENLSAAAELAEELRQAHRDPRLHRLATVLDRLAAEARGVYRSAKADHLRPISRDFAKLADAGQDARLGRLLASIPSSDDQESMLSTLLLDLIRETGAERGFVLLYRHDTTEAAVVAARDYQTRVLAAEEYAFSRTVLAELFDGNRAIRLADARAEPGYRGAASVRDLRLRSVLAVPMLSNQRATGAVYLEDRRHPRAFDDTDQQLVERACAFVARHSAPAGEIVSALPRERRCYLDPRLAGVEIIGRSPAIAAVLEQVRRLADKPVTVLVEGETGTGKELVARAVHALSGRRDRPFVAINCGAIPESLLESELFGHERGTFTGATAFSPGQLSRADGGTLFLDEIHELAAAVQPKLLRFLETGELDRLGRRRAVRVDVRVVAASSRNLAAEAAAGRFHEALFYRLNVVRLSLPPLRERRRDVPLLLDYFLDLAAPRFGARLRVSPEVVAWLASCSFPGNVRQLRNLVDRLYALAHDDLVRWDDVLPMAAELGADGIGPIGGVADRLVARPVTDFAELEDRRREIRAKIAVLRDEMIDRALEASSGKVAAAARALGVDRRTLYKYLRRRRSDLARRRES